LYTGVGTFRSGEETKDEFAGLDLIYQNINNERIMKNYESSTSKLNDIFSVIDVEYLLRLILHKRALFSTDIKLNDN
jgi:hypothetical protein